MYWNKPCIKVLKMLFPVWSMSHIRSYYPLKSYKGWQGKKTYIIKSLPYPNYIYDVHIFLSLLVMYVSTCVSSRNTGKTLNPCANFLMCDASNHVVGASLGQRNDWIPYVGHYASMVVDTDQRKLYQREILVIVYALDKFRHYFLGTIVNVFL